MLRFASLVLLTAVLTIGAAWAQSERGTISGAVRDASGAVVPDAKVVVTNAGTGLALTLATGDTGSYSAPGLAVGEYSVRVEKLGFRPAAVSGITVNAATSVRVDVALEVGTSQQVVEVAAAVAQLSTEDAKSSSTVTNKLVDELPLVVGGTLRSPFDLAALTPEGKNLGGDNGFILGGGQAAGYGTTLDGVSTNTTRALSQSWVAVNAPSLEAITEFTVDTNGFKAEYGHAAGGVMTFVSKSGTNEFHGSAYEFLRNNVLDANNFFNNARGIARPIYKQHDFGGAVGGPVWIPKLYNGRNKSFFFFAYEGFRNRAGATGATRTVPTAEMYDGNFSNWVDSAGKVIPIYDPTTQTTNAAGAVTRQPFSGNIVPRQLFDPVVQTALKVFQSGPSGVLKPNVSAAPGTPGYVLNNFLVTAGSEVRPQTKYSVKADQVISEKHRVSFYYGRNRTAQIPSSLGVADLPGYYVNYNDLQRNSDVWRGSWDWTISPTKFNHFYGGGNDWKENHDPPQATVKSGIGWKDKICIGNVPDCDQNLLNFNFSNGYSQWGGRANNGSENAVYSFNDDFSWIKGKHSFKFGGMYQASRYNGFGRQCVSGCVTFDFKETGRPGDTNFTTAGGNPFASLLLGYADNGQIDTIRYIGQQWPYFAGYAQDDWRVTQRLTLNLGVRWETQLPPTGENDSWSDFGPTTPNPKAGNIPGALLYAGTGAGRVGSRTLADSYFKAFGPRFGLAYSWKDKTVIRASAGISYGAITTVTGSTHQRGFTATPTFPNQSDGIQATFRVKDGMPPWDKPPFIDPGFALKDSMPWFQGREATRPPAFTAFNFSVQHQLSSTTVMEVSYNGVLGSRLQSNLLNYNQVDPRYLKQYGPALLRAAIDSPQAIAAGIQPPWAGFKALWGSQATVQQALRPYPQYSGVDTYTGGGDHSGHSTYHAGIIKFDKRAGHGLTLQTSYVFSKILTDSDSYWGAGSTAMDQYNRGLEKSIGQFDVTHNFKLGLVYELPIGKGKPWLNHGPLSYIAGNWRLSSIHYYSNGQPLGLSTTIGVPLNAGGNRPQITTYDNWQGAVGSGGFDPFRDRFTQPASFFGTQPADSFGNQTRYNPNFRQFGNYNENISVAKTFPIKERFRVDFRAEFFNAFNRVRFGTGSLSLQSAQFGQLTSSGDLLNSPRQMQMALKFYF
jgi:outer membrane receptor protein involved in Fe transport